LVGVELGVWFYVDGVYGGVGLVVLSIWYCYVGVEWCDFFIVDLYKWFFVLFDCCVLIYCDF